MNLEKYCEIFYSSHYVPVSIIYGDEIKITYSSLGHINFNSSVFKNIIEADNPIKLSNLFDSGQYAVIKTKEPKTKILLGPTYSMPISESIAISFINSNIISETEKEKVYSFLSSIPVYTYNQFFALANFLYSSINDESVDIVENFTDKKSTEDIASNHAQKTYIAKEEETAHNTFYFENNLLSYVSKGEVDKLKAFIFAENEKQEFKEGQLADTPLRQSKNLFIGFATIVGKIGAINGGMDIEDAYRLIDIYIQECEKAQSVDAVKILQFNMLIDFTERVAQSRMPKGVTKEIYSCIQYIQNNTNKNISIDDLIKYANMSRSSIIKRFKKETGISIGNYITQCKISDAKRLLTYSNQSLSEISNYLCYSSQAYFQTVFKNEIGITPNEYRKRYQIETKQKG